MKKTGKKIWAWLLTVVILISLVDGIAYATELKIDENNTQTEEEKSNDVREELAENSQDEIITESVYEGSNFRVTFSIFDAWEDNYNANITIENIGESVIKNWYLKFPFDEEIADIWNAKIDKYEEGLYVIKNATWNMNIPVNGKVSFGFSSSKKFTDFPPEYALVGENSETPTEDYTISYQLDNDWGEGFTGTISITNNTDITLEDWALEFDFDRTIINIWNGVIASHDGSHYLIQNDGNNSNISAGGSISFGFSGEDGQKENEPYGYLLYTHSYNNTKDADDNLNYNEDYLKVQSVLRQLTIGYAFADTRDSVTSNLTLVKKIDDVSIDWKSSDPDILGNNGVVNRPDNISKYITLTAVVSSNDYSETKEFKVRVIKNSYIDFDIDGIKDIDTLELLYLYNEGDLENLQVYLNEEGYISFISGGFSDIIVESPSEAILALYGIKTLMGCKSPKEELQWVSTNKDNYGTSFRFEQIYKNIPVFGSSLVVSTDQNGKTSSLQSSFVKDINISTTPSISEKEAIEKVNNSGYTVIEGDKLYIYMNNSIPNLAWNIYAIDNNGLSYNILVSASTGEILFKDPNAIGESSFGTTTGSGKSELGTDETFSVLYTKKISHTNYTLRDVIRNISIYDMQNQSEEDKELPGTLLTKFENTWEPDEVSAMANVVKAYDFYLNNFGREGMDNKNSEISIVIRDRDEVDNAHCYQKTDMIKFGLPNRGIIHSAAAALDTVGHEYTHGVLHHTTALTHRDIPGAIHEGYGDIFGYFIEGDNDAEWLHREDNTQNGRALRNMSNPEEFGGAAAIGDSNYIDCTVSNDDNGGVHQNSTIISHACYLMWKNGITNKKRLADLWYHSHLLGYSSNATFSSVRINVLAAAKNMRMSANEIQIIKNAFEEVGIKGEDQANIEGTNIVTGKVVEADADTTLGNNTVLAGVFVFLTRTSGSSDSLTAFKQTTTSNDGIFYFKDIVPGTYILTMSKNGYYTTTQTITLTSTKLNYYCNTVELISQAYSGLGQAKGSIVDSLTGEGVEGLDLTIRSGLNSRLGTVVSQIKSQSDGSYETTQLATGHYCVEVVDNRELEEDELPYYTTYFNIKILGGLVIPEQNATVSTALNADQMRIVLEWGATPKDLDSHLIGPTSDNKTFHIYYALKKYKEQDTLIAELDLDDTTGYGPETTTIYNPIEGEYIFYVYNYSGSPDMSTSGATVKVYTGASNEPEYVFNIPMNQSGRYWTVFKYDSKTKEIVPINIVGSDVEDGKN